MASIYRHELFQKFQIEVLGVSAFFIQNENQESTVKIFKVQDFEEK